MRILLYLSLRTNRIDTLGPKDEHYHNRVNIARVLDQLTRDLKFNGKFFKISNPLK